MRSLGSRRQTAITITARSPSGTLGPRAPALITPDRTAPDWRWRLRLPVVGSLS
jgi:hypothetical protein